MFAFIEKTLSFVERGLDSFPREEPVRPPQTLFAFVLHYARPAAPFLAVIAATDIAIAVLEVYLFSFVGGLIDRFAVSAPELFVAQNFWWLAGLLVIALVLIPVLDFLHEMTMNQGVMSNFPMRVRWLAHRYVLRQSVRFFQDDFAGRVATKVLQTSLAVRDILMSVVGVFIYVGVYFTSALVVFAMGDWRMMLPLLAWLVAYALVMKYFLPRMQAVAKAQADARSEMTGRIVDSYTNIQTVKLFAHAAREETYAQESMTPFLKTAYRQFRLVTGINVVVVLCNALLFTSTAMMGVWLWTAQEISAGAVAVALGLILRMQGIAHWLMWELSRIFEYVGTIQDGLETISKPQTLVDQAGAKDLAVHDGGIRYSNVRFHYGKEGGVLENLSLEIAPGEKVGLVGPSGAGKSTVVNLLLRFFDTEAGRIAIDDQDIARVTQDSLRSKIGLVTQDTALLHRSVRDNIRYGHPDADEASIMAAVRAAKADEFIDDLADMKGRKGLDAHVGERGVKLSGGQRQRIAIARVILKDAPILVLDEATSALDSEVEAAIQESLSTLMQGKTVIAIAHRLSTIAAMDRLIVMDQGRIVEQGSHDELLAANGLYARLWQRQSGGFLDLSEQPRSGTDG